MIRVIPKNDDSGKRHPKRSDFEMAAFIRLLYYKFNKKKKTAINQLIDQSANQSISLSIFLSSFLLYYKFNPEKKPQSIT